MLQVESPFDLSATFRKLLDEALSRKVVEAADLVWLVAHFETELSVAGEVVEFAYRQRHMTDGVAHHAELCKLRDELHAETVRRLEQAEAGEAPAESFEDAEAVEYGDLRTVEVAKRIRAGLRARSGRRWPVRCGNGTSCGWIYIGSGLDENDRKALGELLGLDGTVGPSGEFVPSSHEYYREYIDRAEGRKPAVCGTPYWD